MKNIVKITSGLFRGRAVSTPGGKTHPMGERERLALFNMISEYLPGAVVLDAFAGSGALGLEALSRGADKIMFVDNSAEAVEAVKRNIAELGVNSDAAKANRMKVSQFETDVRFDVILADPPYDSFEITDIEHLVQFVKKEGILVLSHPYRAPDLPGVILEKSRKYAGATISVYVKS